MSKEIENERKATDVILKVEQEVIEIKAYLRNLDGNVKIMLSRLNELMSEAESGPVPTAVPSLVGNGTKPKIPPGPSSSPKTLEDLKYTNRFEEAMSRYGIENTDDGPVRVGIKGETIQQPPSAPPPVLDDDPGLVEEVIHKGQRRVQRVSTAPGTRVSVSQRVVAESGAPVFLASVEIFDANRQLVKQTRTNPKGIWIAALEPGPYSIHVSKREFGPSKKAVELRYDVTINPTDRPVELDSPSGIEG